ncbi:FxDxF family PEP-CTERM protein [Roseateles sp. DJS-2-20]|uniref:FxDxF family PEP-CTERM protein n=1 Tax=Roseateles paludis TaxID=3145238 RepID=A0ABV0G5X4_9BURK
MSSTLQRLAVTAALVAAPAAFATSFITSVPSGGSIDASGPTWAVLSHAPVAKGPFGDTWALHFDTAVSFAAEASSIKVSGFSAGLYGSDWSPIAMLPVDEWTPLALASGDYFISVTGTAVKSVLASSYTVSVSAVPVPEPETYALFAAGLGIVGFVASRRRRDH